MAFIWRKKCSSGPFQAKQTFCTNFLNWKTTRTFRLTKCTTEWHFWNKSDKWATAKGIGFSTLRYSDNSPCKLKLPVRLTPDDYALKRRTSLSRDLVGLLPDSKIFSGELFILLITTLGKVSCLYWYKWLHFWKEYIAIFYRILVINSGKRVNSKL